MSIISLYIYIEEYKIYVYIQVCMCVYIYIYTHHGRIPDCAFWSLLMYTAFGATERVHVRSSRASPDNPKPGLQTSCIRYRREPTVPKKDIP